MLRCGDGSLYTGWTARLPVALAYTERFETEHEARSREWHIKRLTRAQKLALIKEAEHAKNGA